MKRKHKTPERMIYWIPDVEFMDDPAWNFKPGTLKRRN